MAEFQRQGPLDGFSLQQRAVQELGAAGVGIGEIRYEGAVNLRARREDPEARDALALSLGMALPAPCETTRRDGQVLLGLGPDEWLLLCSKAAQTAENLDASLGNQFVAVTELSDNFITLFVRGPRALDLLAKGVPIDLDPSAFPPGRCAQTLMSKAEIILYRGVEDWSESYMMLCRPSFAQYIFAWLQDAAQEYGLAILST